MTLLAAWWWKGSHCDDRYGADVADDYNNGDYDDDDDDFHNENNANDAILRIPTHLRCSLLALRHLTILRVRS